MVKLYLNVVDDELNLNDTGIRIVKKGLNYTTQDLLANLISFSPVDTGLLRSWAVTENGDTRKTIKTPAVYASWVNDGTGEYGPTGQRIKSKTPGKPLVFQGSNGPVFAMSIKGQKGQKFVEKSMNATKAKVEQLFIRAISEEM